MLRFGLSLALAVLLSVTIVACNKRSTDSPQEQAARKEATKAKEEAKKKAEKEARKKAEAAKKKAEEEARRIAEEEEAWRVEQEKLRKRAEEAAKKAEEEGRRKAEELAKKIAEEEAKREAEEEAFRHRLGGGYKEAKWADPPDKVKEVLGGRVVDERFYAADNSLASMELYLEKTKVVCKFNDGGLAKVKVEPSLQDSDEQGFMTIRDMLTEKYGEYEKVDDLAVNFGFGQMPLDAYRWEDADMTILLHRMKPVGALRRTGTASSTTIEYESKRAKEKAATAKKAAEDERRQKAAEETRNKVGGAL